ncbi:MAG: response regulator transcription factor [Bacteroidales bacterium]|nr:response regulator transcription factor [Bacteroidales bacterium]
MAEIIRCVIVEDESRSVAALSRLLEEFCPQVRVSSIAGTVEEAVNVINETKPDLVFLDIALPDGDGFTVLDSVKYNLFEIIFITAFDKFAVKAFEYSALHYLLKPIDQQELKKAVSRFSGKRQQDNLEEKLELLQLNINGKPKKLLLPTSDGFEIVSFDDIIRFEASHNYTNCYLAENRQILVSKPLCTFESMLSDLPFARVHNKHIVNLKYIKKYVRGHGGSVLMTDREEVNVSKSRKADFLEKLQTFARNL